MPASTRMFYFDALTLGGSGKVFIYEPVNDPLHPVEFWHRRFSGDYRSNHIYSRLFSPDGSVLQSITESIDQNGATLIQLELAYPADDVPQTSEDENESIRRLPAKINEATTFLFGPPDSTMIAKYQIEYREPGPDSVRVILTRARHFVKEELYHYQGKDYPALRFAVDESLETETEGFTESQWEATEIYALGLGLVYYKKPISDEFVLEYRLKDIRDYDDFLTLK